MTGRPCCYEIRVAEPLAPGWSRWFDDLDIVSAEGGEERGSVLRGSLPDQAALFGVLGRVRNLNLTLIAVRRLPE